MAMTDASGSFVNETDYVAFGNIWSSTGSVGVDLRFPGQMYQHETGLFYNWNRSYDPTIARYTQPDPLGLVDGPSRYAYVGNDPLQKVDPSGEAKISLPSAGGPAGGFLENPKRRRYYDMSGNPICDVDFESHGVGIPHFHFWYDGVRQHPGQPALICGCN